ncbi:hypothetical protein ACQP3F_34405, partial [Escherichia coli]
NKKQKDLAEIDRFAGKGRWSWACLQVGHKTKTAATVSRFCLFTCLLDETRKVPLCISHG